MKQELQDLLQQHLENEQKQLASKTHGTFMLGFVTGVVFAYSGTLGFGAGVIAGCMLNGGNQHWAQERAARLVDTCQTFMNRFSAQFNNTP